jgi:hypothetical protein
MKVMIRLWCSSVTSCYYEILEDTLAEQCLSKNFISEYKKIHVRQVEGTLMTYTNDIEVKLILVMLIRVFRRIKIDEEESSVSEQI